MTKKKEKKEIPLSIVKPGQKVRLLKVDSGQGLRTRLITMGLMQNVEFSVVSNSRSGPFIIRVKGSKIALGRGAANKIMVILEQ